MRAIQQHGSSWWGGSVIKFISDYISRHLPKVVILENAQGLVHNYAEEFLSWFVSHDAQD